MTITNIFIQLKRKNYLVSESEAQMLQTLYGDLDIFDGYLIATPTSIINALENPYTSILQDGKISQTLPNQDKEFYGIFNGLGNQKILVFPER